jgi:hypothetical protein
MHIRMPLMFTKRIIKIKIAEMLYIMKVMRKKAVMQIKKIKGMQIQKIKNLIKKKIKSEQRSLYKKRISKETEIKIIIIIKKKYIFKKKEKKI